MPKSGFVVYRSSAGSGKTFTLVKEYLRLALDDGQDPPVKYRAINAITFTNKASAEMKDRILLTLRRMKDGHPGADAYLDLIGKELKLPADVLRKRAAGLLTAILHHYSDFSISTIDSFTHRVIRTFAHELRLPQQFELSTDRNALVRQGVDQLLDRCGKEDELTSELLSFMKIYLEEEKSWNIRDSLIKHAESILKAEDRSAAGEVLIPEDQKITALKKHLYSSMHSFAEQTKTLAGDIVATLQKNNFEAKDFSNGTRGIWGWLHTMHEWNGDLPDLNKNAEKAIENAQWTTKTNKEATSRFAPLLEECNRKAEKLLQLIREQGGLYITYRLLASQLSILVLFRDIRKQMDAYRNENDMLLISDLNKLISDIVREQPAPFIYERLGTRYRHYLIDEFQDTSLLQWTNLLPLIHQSLSEGHFNMIVGDAKQAIYRFRGGEVQQFTDLPEVKHDPTDSVMKERAAAIRQHFAAEQLGVNYRSAKNIVEFNNTLYEHLMQGGPPEARKIFDRSSQEHRKDNGEGYVEIRFPATEEANLTETLQIIQRLQEGGTPLRAIALLTRNNKDAAEIAHFLQAEGLPVISSESLNVNSSPKVKFLLQLFHAVADTITPAGETFLKEFIANTKGEKFDLQRIKSPLKLFSQTRKQELRTLSLIEISESMIKDWELQHTPDPYLSTFCDLVLNYSSRQGNDLSGFLEWWEDQVKNEYVQIPEGTNAIRVMTIHKSKGLEFPVVIIPRCSWETQKLPDLAEVELSQLAEGTLHNVVLPISKNWERTPLNPYYTIEREKAHLDNLNLLYVATTRASKAMYLLCKADPGEHDVSAWINLWLHSQHFIAEAGKVFSLGTEHTNIPVEHIGDKSVTPRLAIQAAWRNRLRLRRRYRDLALRGFDQSARNKGIIIHHALSQMKRSHEVGSAVEQLIKQGVVQPEEREAVTREIDRVMSNENLRQIFDRGECFNERELLLADGDFIRPDRIQIMENQTHVLDFKTGIPREEHMDQIQRYARVLEQAGFPDVNAWLVYTDTGEMMNGKGSAR